MEKGLKAGYHTMNQHDIHNAETMSLAYISILNNISDWLHCDSVVVIPLLFQKHKLLFDHVQVSVKRLIIVLIGSDLFIFQIS